WLVPVARMVAGEISADTLAVNLESGEQSMTNALDAVEDVDRVLNGIELEIESRIRSFERTEDILMAALGVAAALIGGSVVWLVLRLNTASRRLAESEVRFRQITENLRESIWIADPDFTTYYY